MKTPGILRLASTVATFAVATLGVVVAQPNSQVRDWIDTAASSVPHDLETLSFDLQITEFTWYLDASRTDTYRVGIDFVNQRVIQWPVRALTYEGLTEKEVPSDDLRALYLSGGELVFYSRSDRTPQPGLQQLASAYCLNHWNRGTIVLPSIVFPSRFIAPAFFMLRFLSRDGALLGDMDVEIEDLGYEDIGGMLAGRRIVLTRSFRPSPSEAGVARPQRDLAEMATEHCPGLRTPTPQLTPIPPGRVSLMFGPAGEWLGLVHDDGPPLAPSSLGHRVVITEFAGTSIHEPSGLRDLTTYHLLNGDLQSMTTATLSDIRVNEPIDDGLLPLAPPPP